MAPEAVHRKIQRCLALAQDPRCDPTTAETALRQAAALMRLHGIDTATPPPPATEAQPAHRGRRAVLRPDGWHVA